MNMRVITAIIGIPILLICCYFGGWLMTGLCGLLAVLTMLELCGLLEKRGVRANQPLAVLATLALVISLGLAKRALGPFMIVLLLAAVAYAAYTQWRDIPLSQGLAQVLSALYIGCGFGSLLLLRLDFSGWALVLLALLNVWATDIAAYEIGRRWGRYKLAPQISPNKTIEGALAGLCAAMIICGFYMFLALNIHLLTAFTWALLFSALAQAGDLLESALKRWAGVKDSGSLLPGHGGILDRFDSLLLSAPCIAILLLPALL